MEQVNYASLLPTEPPEDMISWLISNDYFKKAYITYKSSWVSDPLTGEKERMVHCTCSDCGNEWYAARVDAGGCHGSYAPAPFGFINPLYSDSVISGGVTICPYCDSEAEAIHIGNIRDTKLVDELYPMTIERVNDNIALIAWRIVRVLHKNGRMAFEKYPYEAYVCEDRKLIRLTAYTQGFFRTRICTSEWEQRKRYNDTFGMLSAGLVFPSNADILVGTSLENSKLDMYLECDDVVCPVSYCNLFLKHKNVENLIMQGMGKLVNEKILKLFSYYVTGAASIKTITGINWRERKPHRMIGLSKDEFKSAKKDKWTGEDIIFFNSVKSAGICPEDLPKCRKYGYSAVEEFIEEFPSENIMKVLRYLDRQRKKYRDQRRSELSDLRDYWHMLPQLGEDLNDNEVIYPQNLIRAHDRAAERIEYNESEELKVAFVKRFHELSRFDYVYNGLFIRPAASEAELVAEGKKLHHCVGGYAKRHASGDTAIFFIRHVSDPEISYFTPELDEKNLTVCQNRGSRNCNRTDEVIVFEEKWLEHIRNLKEDKRNGNRVNKRGNKTGRTENAAA